MTRWVPAGPSPACAYRPAGVSKWSCVQLKVLVGNVTWLPPPFLESLSNVTVFKGTYKAAQHAWPLSPEPAPSSRLPGSTGESAGCTQGASEGFLLLLGSRGWGQEGAACVPGGRPKAA